MSRPAFTRIEALAAEIVGLPRSFVGNAWHRPGAQVGASHEVGFLGRAAVRFAHAEHNGRTVVPEDSGRRALDARQTDLTDFGDLTRLHPGRASIGWNVDLNPAEMNLARLIELVRTGIEMLGVQRGRRHPPGTTLG